MAVAGNPVCPQDIPLQLPHDSDSDSDSEVQQTGAANPALPRRVRAI